MERWVGWWCGVKGRGEAWTGRRQHFIIRRVNITCQKTVHDHVQVFASIIFDFPAPYGSCRGI